MERHRRRPRLGRDPAHRLPAQTLRVGGDAPKRAYAIRLGARTMRSMTRWPMRGMLEKQFAKAGGIDLPDYCCAG